MVRVREVPKAEMTCPEGAVGQDVKQSSSRWIHRTIGVWKFAWQAGYGAFTLSASNPDEVREGISTQQEHHQGKTFQEEYLQFLRRSGVEYNEGYFAVGFSRRPLQDAGGSLAREPGALLLANFRCPSGTLQP